MDLFVRHFIFFEILTSIYVLNIESFGFVTGTAQVISGWDVGVNGDYFWLISNLCMPIFFFFLFRYKHVLKSFSIFYAIFRHACWGQEKDYYSTGNGVFILLYHTFKFVTSILPICSILFYNYLIILFFWV